MVVAQAVLATPIITALTHRAVEEPWQEYGGALRVDGATRLRSIRMLLTISRRSVLTAVLAGFGRTISEVGAVLIVGGNIAGYTRAMTTTIVLKTSEGELGLALGLGYILIGVSIAVSARALSFGREHETPAISSNLVGRIAESRKHRGRAARASINRSRVDYLGRKFRPACAHSPGLHQRDRYNRPYPGPGNGPGASNDRARRRRSASGA
jgi:hypothetical protein